LLNDRCNGCVERKSHALIFGVNIESIERRSSRNTGQSKVVSSTRGKPSRTVPVNRQRSWISGTIGRPRATSAGEGAEGMDR
jgi:hypothetical protein